MISFKFLCSILVITYVVQQCNAIKCWDCRSDLDPTCDDPFNNTTFPLTDCDHNVLITHPGLRAIMCRKIKQEVNGVSTIIRGCGFLEEDKKGCTSQNSTHIFREVCNCKSDGCNSF